MRIAVLLLLLTTIAYSQASSPVPAPDAAYAPLTQAFAALGLQDYDTAILFFRKAAAASPQRADIRKNLAYTLLRIGDSESARVEFGDAMRIDPADLHVALEYAFLCFEAREDSPARKAEARRIFGKVRTDGDAESRATADAAFHNIDEPLASGIDRWKKALEASQPTFSAHYELAQLAEQRDETELAAENYRAAFRLLPDRKSVLLELARVEKTRGNPAGMIAALIAASRGPEPRTAELAREQLPARYPYVYEFRQALELDPANVALRKELAYLLVRMSENGQASRQDAENEFSILAERRKADSPQDYAALAQLGLLYLGDQRPELAMPLLNEVMAHADQATANLVRTALHLPLVVAETIDPRAMGERSFQAGYFRDALRYFSQAQEADPQDKWLALRLASTNNLLHDDVAALKWYGIARQSNDAAIAAEANKSWKNLRPEQAGFRTTVWLYPLYSSRWGDLFGYGQVKTEWRRKGLPLHPYASVRLAGDVKRTTGGPVTQSLSESAFITGVGVATDTWRGATGWFEAGVAVSYLSGDHWSDYRGGVSYSRTRGAALSGDGTGWFLETTADSVFISHFGNDLINYGQARVGYTGRALETRAQAFWSQNVTFDARQQSWANFVEMGPGIRIHPPGLPPSLWLNFSALRGVYLRNEGNLQRPNFNDFRIGIWYAFTK